MSKSALSDDGYRLVATVTKVVNEAPNVVSIYFTTDKTFDYVAGQYLTVFFDDLGALEGKAYSLSSSPYDDFLRITVKKRGTFSSRLCAMKAGDCFDVSQAYGTFDALPSEPVIALCAGVGIAPVLSIIKTAKISGSGRNITCLHSLSYVEDQLLCDEIDGFVQYHITRERVEGCEHRRINAVEVAYLNPGKAFYLCGSVDFVRDMRNGLIAGGADPRKISTEVFFVSE